MAAAKKQDGNGSLHDKKAHAHSLIIIPMTSTDLIIVDYQKYRSLAKFVTQHPQMRLYRVA